MQTRRNAGKSIREKREHISVLIWKNQAHRCVPFSRAVRTHKCTQKKERDYITKYCYAVKNQLLVSGMSEKWLIETVRRKTGMYLDRSYLKKIMDGTRKPKKLIAAINDTLWHTPWCPVVDD